jgi:hypothetical protein
MAKPGIANVSNVLGKYGKWSYNTPGSKSWNKCFEDKTETESKNIMKSGVNFNHFTIEEIEFDFTELKRYIIKRNKEFYREEVVERYDQLVRKSDDPFEILEKMDKEKESGKTIRNSEQSIDDEYASVEKQLTYELDKKAKRQKLTKDRVANRIVLMKPLKIKKKKNGDRIVTINSLMIDDNYTHYKKTFSKAQIYCNDFNYGGYTDWRLPTIDELRILYNNKKKFKSFMRDQGFWSSTESKGKDRVQTIGYQGDLFTHPKEFFSQSTICVR